MTHYKYPKFTVLKCILIGLLFLWGCEKCHAQNPPQKVNADYQFKAGGFDSTARMPKRMSHYNLDSGAIAYNGPDSSYYFWTGHQWLPIERQIKVNNGLFDSAGVKQTGEPIGQSGSPARLFSHRNIPTNGFSQRWLDSAENSVTGSSVRIWDTSGLILGTNGRIPLKIVQNNLVGLFEQWQPWNYNFTYNSVYRPGTGNSTVPGVSIGYASAESGDAMPDNVYQLFGYNQTASANRSDTSEAAARISFETNFLGEVDGVGLDFEYHDPEITTFDGTIFRIDSKYISKKTGYCIDESFIDNHRYFSVRNNKIFAQLLAANGGNHGQLGLYGDEGEGIVSNITFYDSSGVPLSNILSLDGGDLAMGTNGAGAEFAFILKNDGTLILNNSASQDPANWKGTIMGTDSAGSVLDPSAQLELLSVHKGFMKPRMSSIQRLAISSPAEGLEVYDLTLHHPFYFNGTIWVQQ